jgi:hypothetical protein
MPEFIHQYDERGNHRLLVSGPGWTQAGEWAGYRDFAQTLTPDGHTYEIATAYHNQPPELVREVVSLGVRATAHEVAGVRP